MKQENNLPLMGTTLYPVQTISRYSMAEALADNLASEFCQKLYRTIRQFDEQLDSTCEAGIRLVTFGQSVTFSVSRIGYTNPSLLHFYGVLENGQPVELIQHVSQISFLLTTVPRVNPEKPKTPIGFVCPAESTD